MYDDIKISRYINSMYDVSKVKIGYNYWYFKILNILLDIFQYKNVPIGTSERDIELNLMLTGHCTFVALDNGEIFTPLSTITGFDKQYNPTMCVWANPVVNDSKVYYIHDDCEVVYNNKLNDTIFYMKSDASMCTFIGKYARLLADIESTIDIYTVNSRLTSIPTTNDQNVAQTITAFFKKLTLGERAIVSDSNIVQQFRNVDINRSSINDKINDWLIARDKVLEMMFRDLGVKMYNPKKAQVNAEELESNDQLLLIQLDDMLQSRKEGLERVNDMFATDIDVEINPRFLVTEYNNEGGAEYELS